MFSDLTIRLRSLLRRRSVESELDAELEFHVTHLTDKFVAAGMPHEEAQRRARLELGGLEQTKEDCRQARGVSLVEHLMRDVSHAWRLFVKSPGFTAAVVLSLALGIGANTAVFSLINALMWRPLPVSDPETLLLLTRVPDGRPPEYNFSHAQFRNMHDRNGGIADIAAYSPVRLSLSIDGSIEPTAEGQLVSGDYFSILNVSPVIGRAIGRDDNLVPNAHPVAMLSHDYWVRRFDAAHSAIGRTITLSGTPFTIIGVTPPGFFGVEVGVVPDIFVPLMMQPAVMPDVENRLDRPINSLNWLRSFGRLSPGVPPHNAAVLLEALWREEVPPPKPPARPVPERFRFEPASAGLSFLRPQFSQSLFVLLAIVSIVLVIACANIANLLLARSAARRPEFAMRLALGAGRARLIGQLMVESGILAIAGGACGIGFAYWAAQFLVDFMSAGRTPIALDLTPDLRVLSFTAAVSIATGVFFGLAPAMQAARGGIVPRLKDVGRGIAGRRGGLRLDRMLAVSQVALSLLLLIGAGLFVRSLNRLNGQETAAVHESVLMVRVEPQGSDQRGTPGAADRLNRSYAALIDEVRAIPGIEAASMAQSTPTVVRGNSIPFDSDSGARIPVTNTMIYPGYFGVMGIPFIAGRDLTIADGAPRGPFVVLVNQAFARQAFGTENVVGRQVRFAREVRQIVGVVRDSRFLNLRTETPAEVYSSFLQTNTGRGQMVLYARVRGDAGSVVRAIREAVHRVDSVVPLFEVRTLREELDAVLVSERLVATLSSAFGVLALALACVGLYGLFAFTIAQRTTEMGVRMALGAGRIDVVLMVMREALALVVAGTVIGLIGAMVTARLASSQISGLLFRTSATDPATIVAATLTLAAVASMAAYLPARRASRVEPMAALRNE